MLSSRNIQINYGDRTILTDISLDLHDGEILVLLGPNGAGKTTLIRTLNGTVPAAHGEVLLDGILLSDHSRREIARRIAVVAQENETKFPVTVIEYVLAGRFAHGGTFGWETETDFEIAHRSLNDCDLSNYADRLMNELSGGERQRVVLARALATGATILLLDEPTANLDLAHQAMMFRLVRERCKGCNASAVVITHDLNLAAEFGNRVMLLRDGRVFALGTPEHVMTEENIRSVFGVGVLLDQNPISRRLRVTSIFS